MQSTAPLYDAIADGPDNGQAAWLTTFDGFRIRAAHWTDADAKATVLLFPGRTEYIEKYGRTARDLVARGFAVVTVDWRGQGLADRPAHNPAQGHINSFNDYQTDIAAVMGYVRDLGLPEPYYLLGHSMGGCIGLRALHEGLQVKSAAFTGPMWGIGLAPNVRPVAWILSTLAKKFGFDHLFAPGQVSETYLKAAEFDGNTLTSDREMFRYMRDQILDQPDLALGGPSLGWLNSALNETKALHNMPSPDIGCLTFLGLDEDIVDVSRIRDRMERWPNGQLIELTDVRHEVLMDNETVRADVADQIAAHFHAHL